MKRSTILICTLVLALLPTQLSGRGSRSFKAREYQKSYREILQDYSNGETDDAVSRLVAAEMAVVASGDTSVVQPLRKAELTAIRQILPDAGRALLPIIALHETTYLEYRQERQSILISHARELMVELIGIFIGNAETDEDKIIASQMLTSLAGHLQQVRVDSAAAGLYRRALQLDANNTTALIGLSFLHEQYGEYTESVRHLESLIEIDPLSGAAQLRLGVNLVRMEREEAGAIYLRDVLAGDNPSWMTSVAYQELARILADTEALAEARALLEEGVKKVPADPNLLIQLAYLSERNGSFSEDPALHLALRHSDGIAPEPSPRFLYSQLPTAALLELRRNLQRQSEDSLGLLATALAPKTSRNETEEGAR
jgi:tetratricopeptide (TPR) repeat protein